MNTALRFIGLANAAIWFGAVFFFVFALKPAFSDPTTLGLLGQAHAGATLQLLAERYFLIHYICGFVALVHLVAEWLYAGRPLTRGLLGLVFGLILLGLFGGGHLQPKLERLHVTQHIPGPTQEEKQDAARSYRVWSAVAQILHYVILAGIPFYLWRTVYPGQSTRFFNLNQFRG